MNLDSYRLNYNNKYDDTYVEATPVNKKKPETCIACIECSACKKVHWGYACMKGNFEFEPNFIPLYDVHPKCPMREEFLPPEIPKAISHLNIEMENNEVSYDPELTACYDEISETFHHLGNLFTELSRLTGEK